MSKSEVAELREFLDKSKLDLAEVQAREVEVLNLHSPHLTRDFYTKKMRLICDMCQPTGEDLNRINPAVPWPCKTVRVILDPVCFVAPAETVADPGESES